MAATSQTKETFEDYEGFVEKFKPKRTTDDCYTPPQIYDAIRDWACAEYDIDPSRIVRPFYPGGDYERFDYPLGCVVLDNPPFSCLAAIVRFYNMLGIDYFLFAPALTMCSSQECAHIAAGVQIVYENGANVNTGFVTNLDDCVIRSAPTLYKVIDDVQRAMRAETKPQLPKYEYPYDVVTAAMCNRYAKYGVDFRVRPDECVRVTALDAQREIKKAIFGSGYLLSAEKAKEHAARDQAARDQAARDQAARDQAARDQAAALRFELSDRERELQATLGQKNEPLIRGSESSV